ncbi:MAG: hypothetical protein QM710_01915 [Flavobacterium sp.]
MKRFLLFSFLIMNVAGFCQSRNEEYKQKTEEDYTIQEKGILLGAHLSQFPTLEIGYAYYSYSREDSKMPFAGGCGISVENYFLKNYIMVPKLSLWASAIGINFGGSLPWYTDLKGNNSLKLRPEIGIGDKNWRVNFAYNLPIYNHGMVHITDPMLSLNYIIPAGKSK